MPGLHRLGLLLVAALALAPAVDADAKPTRGRTASAPRVRAVGPNVFTKRGVPAISLAKAAAGDPISLQPATTDPTDPPFFVPVVEPFQGKRVLTPAKPYADPVGVITQGGDVRTMARPDLPAGFAFDGVGFLRLALPGSAVGGADLQVTCEGVLPSEVWVYSERITKNQALTQTLMQLLGVTNKASFTVVTSDLAGNELGNDELLTIAIGNQKSTAWRVDRCTIERS